MEDVCFHALIPSYLKTSSDYLELLPTFDPFFQSLSKLGSSFNPWDVGNISKAVIVPLDSRPKKTLNGDRPPSD